MEKYTLERANELSERIDEVDSFISRYTKTWKRGKLSFRKKRLFVGHKGYGYYNSSEIEADKVLSEKIYQALLEYQEEIHKEFNMLGCVEER